MKKIGESPVLITIITLIVIVVGYLIYIGINLKNEEASSKVMNETDSTYSNYLSKVAQEKENYEENVKLKSNPFDIKNDFDGIYKFSHNSDNGSGYIYKSIGVISFENGVSTIKYVTISQEDLQENINTENAIELEGFCGKDSTKDSEFSFSLNNDKSYGLISYDCDKNKDGLKCHLQSPYDLSGCTSKDLELIKLENATDLEKSFDNIIESEQQKIKEEEKKKEKQAEKDFKADCKTYTYEELARNPDEIEGKKVKIKGEVIQALYSYESVDLRVNITEWGTYSTYYKDTIYVTYYPETGGDKILEDDIITIWGTAQGDYSYTSAIGSRVTLPLVFAKYIEINK